MSLSDDDIALVSAFYDGELSPRDASNIRKRLEVEPELREAFEGIRMVSEALKLLRPELAQATSVVGTTPRYAKILAVACIAAAVALGGLFMGLPASTPDTPPDWHRQFLAHSYGTGTELKPMPVTQWIGQAPDLSSARLTFVDIAYDDTGGVFMHYSGVNGCRLTFGTHRDMPLIPESQPDLLTESWANADQHYSVLAVGMDAGRFRAIATLLKERTQGDQPGQQFFATVREATKQAVPCA